MSTLSKLEKPINTIKEVMRYSDVRGVSIHKHVRKRDGEQVVRFSTFVDLNDEGDDMPEPFYNGGDD